MDLVVGLGNPGRRYEETRHNAGFLVVDRLAERSMASCSKKQFGALIGDILVAGTPVVLVKPQSFMNLSGQPTASLSGYFKTPREEIIVVHDELDLPFGQVRIKVGGGHGGHNGLRDLQQKLGTNKFVRVRVGISRPPPQWDVADYVLAKWTAEEAHGLAEVVDTAADAVEAVLRDGPVAAMNHFNTLAKASNRQPGPTPLN